MCSSTSCSLQAMSSYSQLFTVAADVHVFISGESLHCFLVGQVKLIATSDMWLFIHASKLLPSTPHPTPLHIYIYKTAVNKNNDRISWLLAALFCYSVSAQMTLHSMPRSFSTRSLTYAVYYVFERAFSMAILTQLLDDVIDLAFRYDVNLFDASERV